MRMMKNKQSIRKKRKNEKKIGMKNNKQMRQLEKLEIEG
jgi:hypothetical protein